MGDPILVRRTAGKTLENTYSHQPNIEGMSVAYVLKDVGTWAHDYGDDNDKKDDKNDKDDAANNTDEVQGWKRRRAARIPP